MSILGVLRDIRAAFYTQSDHSFQVSSKRPLKRSSHFKIEVICVSWSCREAITGLCISLFESTKAKGVETRVLGHPPWLSSIASFFVLSLKRQGPVFEILEGLCAM